MKKTIEKALFVFALIACIGMMSCSGDDDFTNRKELIKGAWKSDTSIGWQTLEFDGKHWNGTYVISGFTTGSRWRYYSGTYEMVNDDEVISLTGTEAYGEDGISLKVKLLFVSSETLVLQGTPESISEMTQFTKFE